MSFNKPSTNLFAFLMLLALFLGVEQEANANPPGEAPAHASHLVSDGEDLYTVGKLLGHTQIATTQKYAHLANKPLRKAASVFGEKFERLSPQ